MEQDRHRLSSIRKILAILFSALFAVLGFLGYQQTGEVVQLLVFFCVAIASWGVIGLLFKGIEWVLDSLDRQKRE